MRGTPMIYFNALNRPLLIMGVERRLFFLLMALCSSITLTSLFKPLMIGISFLLFLMGLTVGRLLTNSDHQFFSVYQRHLTYQKYYDPLPLIQSPVLRIQKSVPVSGRRQR